MAANPPAPAGPRLPRGERARQCVEKRRTTDAWFSHFRNGYVFYKEKDQKVYRSFERLHPRRSAGYRQDPNGRPELIYFMDGSTIYDTDRLRNDVVKWKEVVAANKNFQLEEDWYGGVDPRVGRRMQIGRARMADIEKRKVGQALGSLAKTLENTNLRFVKLLGKGGCGVCALFDSRQVAAGGNVQYYVVKTVLEQKVGDNTQYQDPDPKKPNEVQRLRDEYDEAVLSLCDEAREQRKFTGGMHTVQAYTQARSQHNWVRMNHITPSQAVTIARQGANERVVNPRSVVHNIDERRVVDVPTWRKGREGIPPQKHPDQRRARLKPERPVPLLAHSNRPAPIIPLGAPWGGIFEPILFPGSNEVLMMEYLPRGDLSTFLIHLDKNNRDIPSRVLWNIWMCFLQMIIAMRFPTGARRDANNESKYGPLEFEEDTPTAFNPPRYNQFSSENNVHFDIDPRNILVGSFCFAGVQTSHQPVPPPISRKDPHRYVPCLKLADFGAMRDWDRNSTGVYSGDPICAQDQRQQGKVDYRTPEQFTQEWEWVKFLPGRKPDPPPANLPPGAPNPNANPNNPDLAAGVPDWCTPVDMAGLYTWKSNLYQFALSMYCLITKRMPPAGPIANKINITITPSNPRIPPHTREAYTYGGYLLNDNVFPHVERKLRETIAQCMCEFPDDRPDWDDLICKAKDKIDYFAAVDEHDSVPPALRVPPNAVFPHYVPGPGSERVAGTLAPTRLWCDTNFGNPPPSQLRNAQGLANWYNSVQVDQTEISGFKFPDAPHDLESVAWLP